MRVFALTLTLLAFFAPPSTAEAAKKYITLTVGLAEEQRVPNMPSAIGDELNYNRNVVKISVAKELKTIRFDPVSTGTTNFSLTART